MKTSNEYVQMVRTCLNGSRIKKQGNWRLGFRGQPIRAERAKAKSCKDDMIIAQGKRSAALGYGRNMIPSFFPSGFARPWRVTLEGKKEVGWLGSLPRAAASATLSWAIIMLPLRGGGRASQPPQRTAGLHFSQFVAQWPAAAEFKCWAAAIALQ